MGAYGSPDTGNLYTKETPIKRKVKKNTPQTNIWLWIVLIIFNILFIMTTGIKFDSIFTALILDSIIIGIISFINLICNLIKKKKIKDDIIFVLSSIVFFFILTMILGSMN
nr:hypothetical protein [Sedimentibacter sp.]